MTPEDKEELKSLFREVLKEEDETISPIVEVMWIYKRSDKPISEDPILAEASLSSTEVTRATRILKWSQIMEIIEPSKLNRESMDNPKNMWKLVLTNDVIYCIIKDIDKFKEDWQTAMNTYGFV